jgi:RNA polymerase sigma factor (sigma-70 family)
MTGIPGARDPAPDENLQKVLKFESAVTTGATVTTTAASARTTARQAHAAELLFTRYRDQIYRFCYARLRSREEAEDAVQNVFMRVHMALNRGVIPEYEAAWLYKIAHNVCLSRGESTARRARLETPNAFDDDDFPVAAREISHDELAGLSEALEAMPANMRTAILLREWQGLSYAEIAEAMALTVPAVETLLFRARRHLAAALEQGTPTPKRKLAGLFTLPVGFFRRLLAAAAPAKLAAGAAVVALTGGGVAAGISIADVPVSGPHASSPVARASVASFSVAPAVIRQPQARQAIAAAVVARQGRHTPVEAAAFAAPVFAPVAPSIAPGAEAQPRTPLAPAATPTSATATPTTTAQAAVPIAVPPAPSPPTPTTTAPAVSVPSVQPPEVAPPTVSAPAVTVPAVDVPAAVAPTLPVSVPVVALP